MTLRKVFLGSDTWAECGLTGRSPPPTVWGKKLPRQRVQCPQRRHQRKNELGLLQIEPQGHTAGAEQARRKVVGNNRGERAGRGPDAGLYSKRRGKP